MLDLLPDLSPAEASPRLAPLVFSTEGAAPRERHDLWRGTYDSFNAVTLIDPPPGEAFEARNEIWSLGPVALMRNSAPAMAFARTARHIRRDGVDHWVIRVARSGATRFRIGDLCFEAGPMQPFLFSLGDPSESDRSAADWVSLYLPRDANPALADGLAALGPGPLRGPGALMLAETMLLLKRRLPDFSTAQAGPLAEAMRSMAAACLLSDVAPRAVAPRDLAVAQRERIRRVIRANIASPLLGPKRIARLAGVSRSQLYRLFEPHGGVARYIQALRLQLVHAALVEAAPDAPIGPLAEQFGFFDASAFSRAFRREFGCPPSEVRGSAGHGVPLGWGRAGAEGARDFGAVLRRLGSAARKAG